ncbi:MAG TPA: PTS system mannose/fructose/sorbose family transporter subunit IID, partial [Deferrisomatales bacterium]|nr:PTS system mannose/fructose/sorbose family transporter subunit IID [Deferrisomatales bacterium]
VFWRGLWLQGSWSYRDMQTLGFAWALEPALRRRYRGQALQQASAGHLAFFNSNPILAAAILGAAVHAESAGETPGGDAARRVCSALMGPCGALGDSFFWGALRPCVVLIALLAAVAGNPWAPWLLLGLFGGLNLAARALFFVLGVRRGTGVAETIQRLDLLRRAEALKSAAALLAGAFVVAAAPASGWEALGIPAAAGWAGLVAVAAVGALLVRRGVGPGTLVVAVASVACGIVWLR